MVPGRCRPSHGEDTGNRQHRGARAENAYCTSPLCCPSHAAIATRRYPLQTGYWGNALAYDGRVPAWHHRVRDAGYEMTAIGKLHFRSAEDDNAMPFSTKNGFQILGSTLVCGSVSVVLIALTTILQSA